MRVTCADCPHLERGGMQNVALFYCGKTKHIVPQRTQNIDGKKRVLFWRVPMTCPLPNDEVLKSRVKVNKKDWQELDI